LDCVFLALKFGALQTLSSSFYTSEARDGGIFQLGVFNKKRESEKKHAHVRQIISFDGMLVFGFLDLGYSVSESAWHRSKIDFGHEIDLTLRGRNYFLDHDEKGVGDFEILLKIESTGGRAEWPDGVLGYGKFSRDVCAIIKLDLDK
jgi:hypothetical protein